MDNYQTFNRDIKFVILLQIDFADLLNFAIVDKYNYNILNNVNFWLTKAIYDIDKFKNSNNVITIFNNYLNDTSWNCRKIEDAILNVNVSTKYQNYRRLILHCYLRTLARFNILIRHNLCYMPSIAIRRYSVDYNINFNLTYKNQDRVDEISMISKNHGFGPLLTYVVSNTPVFSYLYILYAIKDIKNINNYIIKIKNLLDVNALSTLTNLTRKRTIADVLNDEEVKDLIIIKFTTLSYQTLMSFIQFLLSDNTKLDIDVSNIDKRSIIKLLIDYDRMEIAKGFVGADKELIDLYFSYGYVCDKISLDELISHRYSNLDICTIIKLIELDDPIKAKNCCKYNLVNLYDLLNYCKVDSCIFKYIIDKLQKFDLASLNQIDMLTIIVNKISKNYWLPEIKFAKTVFDDIIIEKRKKQVKSSQKFKDYRDIGFSDNID